MTHTNVSRILSTALSIALFSIATATPCVAGGNGDEANVRTKWFLQDLTAEVQHQFARIINLEGAPETSLSILILDVGSYPKYSDAYCMHNECSEDRIYQDISDQKVSKVIGKARDLAYASFSDQTGDMSSYDSSLRLVKDAMWALFRKAEPQSTISKKRLFKLTLGEAFSTSYFPRKKPVVTGGQDIIR